MRLRYKLKLNNLSRPTKKLTAWVVTAIAICFLPAAWSATSIIDSTTPPTLSTANSIITKKQDLISPSSGSFTINEGCPPNFTPYVTISVGSVSEASSTSLLTGYTACVTSATQSGSSITVNYQLFQKYQEYTTSTHTDRWYGADWTLSICCSHQMPNTVTITTSASTSNTSLGKLSYVLYCYPPNSTLSSPSPPAYNCP